MNGSSGTSAPLASDATFVGLHARLDAAAGFATLDAPLIQQTKSEIRTLAAEIAKLAHSALEPGDFFDSFLPRLCVAMGAKGAAVWKVRADLTLEIVCEHSLPSELRQSDGCPAEYHLRILKTVIAEGQPILVPPASVKVDAERPANPLAESLIIVPVRVQDDIEYVLEVIQRPSGGPAAQRGYLRFVAQMADLMADYLRRQMLREQTAQHQRLQQIEDWLTAIAGASTLATRRQMVTEAVCDLLDGDRALLLSLHRRSKVLAVSGSLSFDPRSEIVIAAQALHRQLATHDQQSAEPPPSAKTQARIWMTASGHQPPASDHPISLQPDVDALCGLLGCHRLLFLPLDDAAQASVLIAFATESASHNAKLDNSLTPRLANSFGRLLNAAGTDAFWLRLLPKTRARTAGRSNRNRQHTIQLCVSWAALVSLVAIVAVFPVPQQISASAILQPLSKQLYYAPAGGVVSEVFADEGEEVGPSQPLFRITSHELEATAENLQIELRKIQGQLEEKASLLNRGERLSPLEKDQLEYDLRELRTTATSVELQLAKTRERLSELMISARAPGKISTWNLRNRLLNHPVQPGQLLATTFAPEGPWRLQVAVPDYRAGLVSDAIDRADKHAVRVQFSLTSHPDQVLEAFAVDMAPQVSLQPGTAGATAARVVRTSAVLRNTDQLPLKKDGAVARATIDCGKVPLCWLVFRDAYWALSSRLKMLW